MERRHQSLNIYTDISHTLTRTQLCLFAVCKRTSFSVFWFRQALIVLLQILIFFELDGHWLFYFYFAHVAAKVQFYPVHKVSISNRLAKNPS